MLWCLRDSFCKIQTISDGLDYGILKICSKFNILFIFMIETTRQIFFFWNSLFLKIWHFKVLGIHFKKMQKPISKWFLLGFRYQNYLVDIKYSNTYLEETKYLKSEFQLAEKSGNFSSENGAKCIFPQTSLAFLWTWFNC